MSATNRIEKHKGFTLIVSDGWLTVINDGHGYQVAGPVESDDAVRRLAAAAIPFLTRLAGNS